MKRFLFLAVMMLASTLYASADYSRYYETEAISGEGLHCIRIDWQNKNDELDGDSDNEGDIRNFKESGNLRTFDVYSPSCYGSNYGSKEKIYSVVFTTHCKDSFTITLTTPSSVPDHFKMMGFRLPDTVGTIIM